MPREATSSITFWDTIEPSVSKTACPQGPIFSPWSPGRYPSSWPPTAYRRSEEHTSELQSRGHLVCRLLLEKKNVTNRTSALPAELREWGQSPAHTKLSGCM